MLGLRDGLRAVDAGFRLSGVVELFGLLGVEFGSFIAFGA